MIAIELGSNSFQQQEYK